MVRKTLSIRSQPRSRRSFGRAAGLLLLAWSLLLAGCATLRPTVAAHRPTAATPAAKALTLDRLSSGMSIAEVERLEPAPDKVVTMQSQAMTVVKWIYGIGGHTVELYFTNGFLSSWQE